MNNLPEIDGHSLFYGTILAFAWMKIGYPQTSRIRIVYLGQDSKWTCMYSKNGNHSVTVS